MEKLIRIEPSKCIGCKSCELACSFKHRGEFAPSKARIVNAVFVEEAQFITVTCMQCDEPWCLKACPKGAIAKDAATGVVTVDELKCVGCRTCVSACPFGMIKYLPETRKADKCTLCAPDVPECVIFCPTHCLTFSEEDTPLRGKVMRFVQTMKEGQGEV
ncbi:4Fe-4S dicluster domain-containing protein [Geobacter hydrogenophilus]|uniref:(Fe-S)-binding protein n=1 Tax=Geobacter hydrogenophilus TaxID=40983 RepID=A0A9W6G3X5_9BACT|nr:4Fe-4S dicluster domain-containing protein [Geobacter hydrogenophilus]MBT0892506.1 4Fe-4S dicluster domain-containing protein [Geobacter hydrogenophilus]GLI39902.1 (Fe-S)-binding protein [Geobacter hydrogenophilus]